MRYGLDAYQRGSERKFDDNVYFSESKNGMVNIDEIRKPYNNNGAGVKLHRQSVLGNEMCMVEVYA